MNKKDFNTFMQMFTSASVCVMFDTTYYCDMMCPHCHYACDTKSKNFIPESDIYGILNELNKFNYIISDVHFSGGEITTLEEKNPGYVRRVLLKSLEYNFYTTLLTNGSFIEKDYAGRILDDLCKIYTCAHDKFNVQMSFDKYHKNCVNNAHKLVEKLDEKLSNDNGIKYNFSLTGFKHDPDFQKNFHASPKYINVSNNLSWDLNNVGRAKENNLPNCRDTFAEFTEIFAGDKLKQLIFTPLYPKTDGQKLYGFYIMLVFNCNGEAVLSDAHNPENFSRFKTKYKNPDGSIKILPQIQAELATQLIKHFYGNTK